MQAVPATESNAARTFKKKYEAEDAVALLSSGARLRLQARGKLSMLLPQSMPEWLPACERCFTLFGSATLAEAEPWADDRHFRLCPQHARRLEKKRERLERRRLKKKRKWEAAQRLRPRKRRRLRPASDTETGGAGFSPAPPSLQPAPPARQPPLALAHSSELTWDGQEAKTRGNKEKRHQDCAKQPQVVDHQQGGAQSVPSKKKLKKEQTEKKVYDAAASATNTEDALFWANSKKQASAMQTELDRRFVCDFCGKCFPSSSRLTRHVRTHTGEKPYACDQCDSKFATSDRLTVHKRRAHTGEKPYACDQCDKRFASSSNLTEHKRVHTGEKPYACDLCDSKFASSGELIMHKRRAHTGEKPYACDQCDKKFVASGSLTEHKRCAHTGEKPYACDQCDKKFTQSCQLTVHKRRAHTGEKPYVCDQCDSRFATSYELKVHKRRAHTGERPYACNECDSKFVEFGQLAVHKRRVHTGEKPYACDQCDSKFASSSSLTEHKRVHTGEKPYACDECSTRFARSSALSKHKQRHEESRGWKYVCSFVSHSTAKFQPGQDLLACTTRCKTAWLLDYHVRCCHTAEGLAQRFRTEQQLADFLHSQGWACDRDYVNTVDFGLCEGPDFGGFVRARPDFHIPLFQSHGCVLLVGNDEFEHRRYRCELARTHNIATALAMQEGLAKLPIVYIRFNPHYYTVDGVLYNPPLESRFKKLQSLLLQLQKGQVKFAQPDGINLFYLYYSRKTVPAGAQPWERLDSLYDRLDVDDGNSAAASFLRDCVVQAE